MGKTEMIPIPLYLYTCNPNSVTNRNGGRDYWAGVVPKFLRCIEAYNALLRSLAQMGRTVGAEVYLAAASDRN